MLVLLISLLAQASSCLSVTYAPAPVPPNIVLSYPTTNISTHSPVTLGVGGGALSVSHDYYGLEYKFNISFTSPDGSRSPDIGDYRDFGALCHGRPAHEIPEGKLNGIKFIPDMAGTFTAFWAITYMTGTNATVNETHCDLPTAQESAQTWIYNASFTVVDSTTGASPSAVHTTTTIALDPTPTGTFFEKENAGVQKSRLGLLGMWVTLGAMLAVV